MSTTTERIILVAGSTGKQGSAVIRALLHDPAIRYHIYALTRNAGSPAAQRLAQTYGAERLTLVEGDLNERDSIAAVFAQAQQAHPGGGVWGVYSVMAFPGLGKSPAGERQQGRVLADVALEFGVEAFVYSSAIRAGPAFEEEDEGEGEDKMGAAKVDIERHCVELGQRGLNWIILRPGFFMENFEDFIGSIAFGILKQGLQADTQIALIASEDIGNVAAGVFRNHKAHIHSYLSLTSELSTTAQIAAAHQRATGGHPIPSIPSALAWALLKLNSASRDLVRDFETMHRARASGAYPEFEAEVQRARGVCALRGYEAWLTQRGAERESQGAADGWNQVSVWKLVTGRL